VFENRVLRKTFAPQDKEVTGGWGKMHNEELQDLKLSPNIIRAITSRRVKWWVCGMWHIWRRKEMHLSFLGGMLKKINHSKDRKDGLIFKWIFKKENGKAWTGFTCISRDKWWAHMNMAMKLWDP